MLNTEKTLDYYEVLTEDLHSFVTCFDFVHVPSNRCYRVKTELATQNVCAGNRDLFHNRTADTVTTGQR